MLFFDDADLDYVATAERISGFVEREYGVACYIAISSPVNGMNDIGNKVDELDEIMEISSTIRTAVFSMRAHRPAIIQ